MRNTPLSSGALVAVFPLQLGRMMLGIASSFCKVFLTHIVSFSAPDAPVAGGGDLSDNALAHLAAKDPDAFTLLFHRFFKPVYRYFHFRLRQHEDAEDLTSETFEKVYRKLHTFREQGTPFSAWLFAIARNNLIDHLRRKRDVESIDDVAGEHYFAVEMDLGAIDRAILKEKVWEAVAKLPDRYQQLWALKLTSDLPHREIARLLGTTEGNVNVMIHRSLVSLKESLLPLLPSQA